MDLPQLELALLNDPANAELLNRLGNARKAAGEFEGAVASYRRSLEIASDYLPALYNLGLILRELNRAGEAEECFRRLHERDAHDTDALFHLGALLLNRSQFAEAAEIFRRALQLTPDNAYMWKELGIAYQEVPGRIEDSLRCLRRCVELEPGYAEAHYRLGLVCKKLGRTEEAIASYLRTLEIEPKAAEAHNDLGNIWLDEGRIDQAIGHYREAIRLSPDYAVAHNNLGGALVRKNQLDEALESMRKAIGLQPDLSLAHLNLGQLYSLRGVHDRALQCFRTALEFRPDDPVATECLLFESQRVCDWSRFDELCATQRRNVAERPDRETNPFNLLSIPSTPAEQLHCARMYVKRRLRAVASHERPEFRSSRSSKTKLRIGYLSANFCEHVVAYVMAELFELHDRDRVEVNAYSYGPNDRSPVRQRLVRAFDCFRDISSLSHVEAAATIHADGVDILVDLMGYTQHSRPEIPAMRPAPVQASYMGFPATMGADFIDYLIVDRFVVPVAQRTDYHEKLVFLPGSYYVIDRKRPMAAAPSRRSLQLPESSFVFCCFNQTYRVLPRMFAAWMRLLSAVSDGVLWLLEGNRWSTLNLRQEAAKHGVNPDRLIFAPWLSHDQHLARVQAADLFLDTLPYNAHTTATDALWVGLPVVTCPGETFASRVAGSLLHAAGTPELVTCSVEEYEALALRLARTPHELAAVRDKLLRNRASAPLFDTPLFARNLEAAYVRMWENYLSGNEPRAIEL